ncbi:MAG: alpha/beta fold hydrolase [Azospirillaceae bacterium]
MTPPEARPPPFRARFPWWGGDLQTMRNTLTRQARRRFPRGRSLMIELSDGDVTFAAVNRPEADTRPDRPLAVLIHGLTGSSSSSYIKLIARHFLGAGYPVARANLRGAGEAAHTCRGAYHAGRSEDVATILAALSREPEAAAGLVAVGFSLGANVLLKLLGEEGAAAPLLAAVAVSPPIDLKATQRRMMALRNHLYHRYLLAEMKREALTGPSDLDERQLAALGRVRTVLDFDEHVIAPRNGFAGALDYYRRSSASGHLAGIAVPTLVIHARNDPWIPFAMFQAVDWRRHPAIATAFPTSGGHVGFHGTGSAEPWYCALAERFVASSSFGT